MKLCVGLLLALGLTGACECGTLSVTAYVLLMIPTLKMIYTGGKKYVYIP